MAGSILGNRVLRKEDPKFLTTGGKYVDDLLDEPLLANAAHVTYVRSSVAHGRILGIDTSAAIGHARSDRRSTPRPISAWSEEPATFNPAVTRGRLAIDKVRFVGEPIAVVVTETRQQGEDAIEQVVVDYEVLEALVDPEAAMTSTTLIYEAPAATSSSTPPRSACPTTPATSTSPIARSSSPASSSTNASHRARSRSAARQSPGCRPTMAADGCTSGSARKARRRSRLDHGRQRSHLRTTARHHARRRWRLRRQDHVLPGGDPARSIVEDRRSATALAGDPYGVDDGARPRPRPRSSTSRSAATATARSPTTACTPSRTAVVGSSSARSLPRS